MLILYLVNLFFLIIILFHFKYFIYSLIIEYFHFIYSKYLIYTIKFNLNNLNYLFLV